jgi:hypothetical protein
VPADSGAEVAGILAVSGKESSSSPPTGHHAGCGQEPDVGARAVVRRCGDHLGKHGDLELDKLYEAVWSPPVLTDGRRHR